MAHVSTAADIGSAIAAARKARKLSQAKLAELAGTTQAMVSEIERGKETARLLNVLRLITVVGLRIDISDADGAAQPVPTGATTSHVVFDEPLPDESIDLDAIVGGGGKPKAAR